MPRASLLLPSLSLGTSVLVAVLGLFAGCSERADGGGPIDASGDGESPVAEAGRGDGGADRGRDATTKDASTSVETEVETASCACGAHDRCCPPEAPSVCVSGNDDAMCGSDSALCAACGPTTGCRAVDAGLRCIPVAGTGSPCKQALECKSRVCLGGACAGDGTCLGGSAPCGAGHVGSCCPGLLCMGNCCAPAGTTVGAGSGTLCCPGLTMHQMPGSNDFTCGA